MGVIIIKLRQMILITLTSLICVAIMVTVKHQKAVHTFKKMQSEYTLIIDSGHGGFDGGAESANGVCEKNINLSIAKKLNMLSSFFGINTVMTREDDSALDYDPSQKIRYNKIADIHKRVEIVESVPNAVFISIHLNKFEQSQYKGAQTFYSQNNPLSKMLAEIVQSDLIEGLDKSNNRVAKKAESTIYLMKHTKCPAIIVECGFLSNPSEAALLEKNEYHKKVAVCILSGYIQYLNTKCI